MVSSRRHKALNWRSPPFGVIVVNVHASIALLSAHSASHYAWVAAAQPGGATPTSSKTAASAMPKRSEYDGRLTRLSISGLLG